MSRIVEVKIEKCPFCGGTEFISGGLYGNGGINLNKHLRRAPLHAVVCRDCGSVVRMFTEKPEKLLPLFKRGRKHNKAEKVKNKKAKSVEEVAQNANDEAVQVVEETTQVVEETAQVSENNSEE